MRFISFIVFFFLAPCKDLCFYKLRHKVTFERFPFRRDWDRSLKVQSSVWSAGGDMRQTRLYRVPDNMRVEGGKRRRGGFFILLTESQMKLTRRKSVKLWLITKRLQSWPVASFFCPFSPSFFFFFLFFKVRVQRDFLCASSTICPVKGNICL